MRNDDGGDAGGSILAKDLGVKMANCGIYEDRAAVGSLHEVENRVARVAD